MMIAYSDFERTEVDMIVAYFKLSLGYFRQSETNDDELLPVLSVSRSNRNRLSYLSNRSVRPYCLSHIAL